METASPSPPYRAAAHLLPFLLLGSLLPLVTAELPCEQKEHPNILLITLDDLGWADFQSHDPLMVTPNIRKLREEGMFLNQSYLLPECAPSRSAILTGRYPHTYGLQDSSAIRDTTNFYLDVNLTILPQELKRLNPQYQTHFVGKWHLGHCHPKTYPQARGFDNFYGMLLGNHAYYYNHTSPVGFYDMHDNDAIDSSANGTYKTDLFHAKAKRILKKKIDYKKPFFLFMSYFVAHKPFEVPQAYRDRYCSHVANETRQIHCAMVARADWSIGQLLNILKRKGVYEKTIIVLLSDNGGPALTGASVNWPLRGTKQTVYEGGVRVYTVLRAPRLAARNTTWSGMIHAIDWVPTLLNAVGGTTPSYVHGKNLWPNIKYNLPSSRTEFIYTVNDRSRKSYAAFRYNQWKLIQGTPGPLAKSGWYPPYQLLEQGYPWGADGAEITEDWALYNIEQDPEERNNVYKDPANAAIIQTMKQQIDIYLGVPGQSAGLYPLQPYKPYEISITQSMIDNGIRNLCTCNPSGGAESTACQ